MLKPEFVFEFFDVLAAVPQTTNHKQIERIRANEQILSQAFDNNTARKERERIPSWQIAEWILRQRSHCAHCVIDRF